MIDLTGRLAQLFVDGESKYNIRRDEHGGEITIRDFKIVVRTAETTCVEFYDAADHLLSRYVNSSDDAIVEEIKNDLDDASARIRIRLGVISTHTFNNLH